MDDATDQAQASATQLARAKSTTAIDARLPDLLPDSPGPRLDDHPRQSRASRSTVLATTSTTATSRSRDVPGSVFGNGLTRGVLRDLRHRLDRRADPRSPERDAHDRRQAVPAVLRRRSLCARSAGRRPGRLLGQQHAVAVARRGPDALNRDLAYESSTLSSLARSMSESEKPPIGVIGVGWVGLVTAAVLCRRRPPRGRDGRQRGQDRDAKQPAKRRRSMSPGCPSCSRPTATG